MINKNLLIGIIMFIVGAYLFYHSTLGFFVGQLAIKSLFFGFLMFMIGSAIILAHFWGWLFRSAKLFH